jgi:hypothetical protein
MAHVENFRTKKRPSPWAHAGTEPPLHDLLMDSIVIAVMTKDRVNSVELLRLISSIRRKFGA